MASSWFVSSPHAHMCYYQFICREDSGSIASSLSTSLGASKPISIEQFGKHSQGQSLYSDQRDPLKTQRSSSGPTQTGQLGNNCSVISYLEGIFFSHNFPIYINRALLLFVSTTKKQNAKRINLLINELCYQYVQTLLGHFCLEHNLLHVYPCVYRARGRESGSNGNWFGSFTNDTPKNNAECYEIN